MDLAFPSVLSLSSFNQTKHEQFVFVKAHLCDQLTQSLYIKLQFYMNQM